MDEKAQTRLLALNKEFREFKPIFLDGEGLYMTPDGEKYVIRWRGGIGDQRLMVMGNNAEEAFRAAIQLEEDINEADKLTREMDKMESDNDLLEDL
jgi:hypothetical protein